MPTAEQEEIIRTITRLTPDRKAARRAAEGGPAIDRALWRELAQLGLVAPALPERLGGVGAGLADECVIAEALGRAVAPLPITSAFLAAHILGQGHGEDAERLALALAEGRSVVGAALSADRGAPAALSLEGEGDHQRISGEVADVIDGAALDVLLLPADGRWWAVEAAAEGVERQELRSLDPSRRLASVSLRGAKAVAVSDFDLEAALAIAWTLLAAESVGVAQAALDLTTQYCLDRRQFGEQIGRFQAIKHKLADALVAVEGARSAVFGAVRSARNGAPETRLARMAKITASAAGVQVAAEAVQIHGAIGNTWEHDLHLLLRRAKAAQLTLGSNDRHLDILAEDLTRESTARRASGGGAQAGAAEDEFSLEDVDRAWIAEFRAWLDEHATPERLAAVRGRDIAALQAWQGEMADAGWVGIHWPKRFGGREASFIQQVLYHTEIAARGLPPLVGNRGLSLVGPTLIVHGTPDQQARFLEPSRRADILWASGLSEPGSGSDLASLRTRGVVEGDEIVVTGQKTWTSGAHYSQWMYTLIRTGPLTPKHEGISCVLIPLDAPGVTIRPIRRMNGEPEFNEVFLEGVRVPMTNLIGTLDQGWKVARTTLAHEHSTNFLGAQLRQTFLVDRVIGQLCKRELSGEIDHGLRRRTAQAWINTQLLRLHGLRNMTSIVEGRQPGAEGSVLKLFGQEEEKRLYELALDVRGAEGLVADRPGRAFLGAKAATVGGGTSEIHRNKIAERVLGMPRDPWADD